MGHFSSLKAWCRSYESRYLLLPAPQPPQCEVHVQKRDLGYNLGNLLRLNFKDPSLFEGVLQDTERTVALPCYGQSDIVIRCRIQETQAVAVNAFCPILSPKEDWKKHYGAQAALWGTAPSKPIEW